MSEILDDLTGVWPISILPKKWTYLGSFGAPRNNGLRIHPGVDLGCPFGTDVFAMEDGIIMYKQGWSGPKTSAIIVYSPKTNFSIVYGAIFPGSNLPLKTEVKKGQKIATIGIYPKSSTMLHCEMWHGILSPTRRLKNVWKKGKSKPEILIDISPYLKQIMASRVGREYSGITEVK